MTIERRNLEYELDGKTYEAVIASSGGVMHAFTNPKANDPGFGTVYDALADRL